MSPVIKNITIILRYYELPRKVFIFNYRSMWAIAEANIIIMWMCLEQHIPNMNNRAKNIIKKNATMEFYNVKQQLYLETDALGASLRKSSANEGWNVVPKEWTTW